MCYFKEVLNDFQYKIPLGLTCQFLAAQLQLKGSGRLGISSGIKKADKETWSWNEEVRECFKRKR